MNRLREKFRNKRRSQNKLTKSINRRAEPRAVKAKDHIRNGEDRNKESGVSHSQIARERGLHAHKPKPDKGSFTHETESP